MNPAKRWYYKRVWGTFLVGWPILSVLYYVYDFNYFLYLLGVLICGPGAQQLWYRAARKKFGYVHVPPRRHL